MDILGRPLLSGVFAEHLCKCSDFLWRTVEGQLMKDS